MEWGYSASFSGSASHPVGLLGTVSFGVDAARNSVFAVLHRFDPNQGAHQVIEDSFGSWRLLDPGHTFSLGIFIDGLMPPQSQVALTQTLVSLT
jgi:hypothetical protein